MEKKSQSKIILTRETLSNCHCLMKSLILIRFWEVFNSLGCTYMFEIALYLHALIVSASSYHFLDWSSAVKWLKGFSKTSVWVSSIQVNFRFPTRIITWGQIFSWTSKIRKIAVTLTFTVVMYLQDGCAQKMGYKPATFIKFSATCKKLCYKPCPVGPGCEALASLLFITCVAAVKTGLQSRAPDSTRTRVKDKFNSIHNKSKTEGVRSHTNSPSRWNSIATFQFEFRVPRWGSVS